MIPGTLGLIKQPVGLANQLQGRTAAVEGANAYRQGKLRVGCRPRPGHGASDLLQLSGKGLAGHIPEDQQKFVPSIADERIRAADAAQDGIGSRLQGGVACRMASGIVDGLEPVKVEESQGAQA